MEPEVTVPNTFPFMSDMTCLTVPLSSMASRPPGSPMPTAERPDVSQEIDAKAE